MKEYLNQARQLYMELWAFHLESLLDWQKTGDAESTLKTASNRSMELSKRYGETDFACRMVVAAVDEIDRILKGDKR
ncbi:hypothetical protein ACTQW9_01610 [Lachnospiraceae bacterium LCP19S3_B12]